MRYLLFNKPCGIISQFIDEGMGHPGLKLYIDMADVYAAGRLDHDSEGLLRLSQPERGVRLRLHDIDCESPSHLQLEEGRDLTPHETICLVNRSFKK